MWVGGGGGLGFNIEAFNNCQFYSVGFLPISIV